MASKMDAAILALTSSLLESAVADEASAETVEGVAGSLSGSTDLAAQNALYNLARMHRVKAIGSRARIAVLAESYGHRFWSLAI